MTELKSLAHPDWPYAGTAHEWRGFVRSKSGVCESVDCPLIDRSWAPCERCSSIYQKQNFGFFSQLTKEQQEAALAYRGEENHGDAVYQKQNFGPELK